MSVDLTTTARLAVGGTATSAPLWSEFVTSLPMVWSFSLSAGGAVVLILTIRKLWLENRIASRRWRDIEKEPPK